MGKYLLLVNRQLMTRFSLCISYNTVQEFCSENCTTNCVKIMQKACEDERRDKNCPTWPKFQNFPAKLEEGTVCMVRKSMDPFCKLVK